MILENSSMQNLIRIEADSNYSRLYFSDGSTLLVAKVLRKFEDELDKRFFIRPHRTHLVNTSFVSSYTKGRYSSLLLANGELIPVARRNKKKIGIGLK